MSSRGASDSYPLPVIELFNGKTRRDLIQWALDHYQDEYDEGVGWVKKGDIADELGRSHESVRQNMPVLVQFGVYDVRDPDANIPYYRPAQTDVMDIMTTWDGYPLLECFEYSAQRDLVEFFTDIGDPRKAYSKTQLSDQSSAGFEGISNHIDSLVDAGVVREVEGKRATKFQLDRGSPMVETLHELNDALLRTYQSRSSA